MAHGSQICKFNTAGQEYTSHTSQGPDRSCSIHVTVKYPAATTSTSYINTLMARAATFSLPLVTTVGHSSHLYLSHRLQRKLMSWTANKTVLLEPKEYSCYWQGNG